MKVGDYVLPIDNYRAKPLYDMFEGNRPRKIIRIEGGWIILKDFDDPYWTWSEGNYKVVKHYTMEENE